jgi:hypothetical protein
MGGAEDHFPSRPIAEPTKDGSEILKPSGLSPKLRGMDHGHGDLHPTDRVHFLADDFFDLVEGAPGQREIRVNPGGELADHPRAEHELVARELRFRGILFPCGQKVLACPNQGHRGLEITGRPRAKQLPAPQGYG